MHLVASLWLVAATTHVAHSFHIQRAVHPVLLSASSYVHSRMDEIAVNLTLSTPPWHEHVPVNQSKTGLSKRVLRVSQAVTPPGDLSWPGVEWDETCTPEQITTILRAFGDAYNFVEAASSTIDELQREFTTLTTNYPNDKDLQKLGDIRQLQADLIQRMAPMIRKFFATNGPGVGNSWKRLLNDQQKEWNGLRDRMRNPDEPERAATPERILRLACNLGGTNADGSAADDIRDRITNTNLCHNPAKPEEDTEAITFDANTAYNDKRTYTGINAGVINFCRDFFHLHGTTTARPSDTEIQQEFEDQRPDADGFKSMDLSRLDTTARIVLHEMMHQPWSVDAPSGDLDIIGYKKVADGAKYGYFQAKLTADGWAWSGVWARWMKFPKVRTCDLYPANA